MVRCLEHLTQKQHDLMYKRNDNSKINRCLYVSSLICSSVYSFTLLQERDKHIVGHSCFILISFPSRNDVYGSMVCLEWSFYLSEILFLNSQLMILYQWDTMNETDCTRQAKRKSIHKFMPLIGSVRLHTVWLYGNGNSFYTIYWRPGLLETRL